MHNEENENEEIVFDKKDAVINRLQSAMYLIGSVHCGDGAEEDETCIYCGTPFPCFTAKITRKCSTLF